MLLKRPGNRSKQQDTKTPTALDVVAAYVAALAAGDSKRMDALRAHGYELDWVHNDAFQDQPLTAEQTSSFWPSWFSAFPEMDYEVTRTIAGETVVVTQWMFTGFHSGTLGPPVLGDPLAPTGRAVRFRGVSVYDVAGGLIQREATYMDLATLFVELGVVL